MIWNPFERGGRKILGIDIGTSSIKIAEVTHEKEKMRLSNYADFTISGQDRFIYSDSLKIKDEQIVSFIHDLMSQAHIEARDASIAIPSFSSFSTIIELPQMSAEELEHTIMYEARKHIPLPLAEVKFDWLVLPFLSKEKTIKVLTIAVPNEIVDMYSQIIRRLGLTLVNMEIETFSSARACAPEGVDTFAMLEIGARSTNIIISQAGMVSVHYNTEISGFELTRMLARGLGVDFARAEEIKQQKGLEGEQEIADLLSNLLNSIFSEFQRVVQGYVQQGGAKPTVLLLSGGSSELKGLAAYAQKTLGIPTVVGDPLHSLIYPQELSDALQEIKPSFSVAIGIAMGA